MSQQLNKETLSFKIGLSGTYWGKKPQYSILVNDVKIADGVISKPSGEVEYLTFSCDLEEEQEHSLIIRLENKTDSDTVKNPRVGEPYVIEKDLLLNINSIEVDDISLETLLWTTSKFVPDDSAKPELKACVNLGWNGSYILQFRSPFYLWLLENI